VLHVKRILEQLSIFIQYSILSVFVTAALDVLKYPSIGLGMCICCLIAYLRPEAPGARLAS
jgi:hypothetical protein